MTDRRCVNQAAVRGVRHKRRVPLPIHGLAHVVGDLRWRQHLALRPQWLDLAEGARTWLDLGAGAGFPGLVVAIAGRDRGLAVHLVESNARKCARSSCQSCWTMPVR